MPPITVIKGAFTAIDPTFVSKVVVLRPVTLGGVSARGDR